MKIDLINNQESFEKLDRLNKFETNKLPEEKYHEFNRQIDNFDNFSIDSDSPLEDPRESALMKR